MSLTVKTSPSSMATLRTPRRSSVYLYGLSMRTPSGLSAALRPVEHCVRRLLPADAMTHLLRVRYVSILAYLSLRQRNYLCLVRLSAWRFVLPYRAADIKGLCSQADV